MRPDPDLFIAIRELIAQKLYLEYISEDTDLLKDGALDSVTLVQLILNLEQRFGVRIELSELEIDDLRSVRSIANLLMRLERAGIRDDVEFAHAGSSTV